SAGNWSGRIFSYTISRKQEDCAVSDTRKEEQVQYVPVQMMPMGGEEDEIDLLELWRILLKGKWIIAGVTLCCVLAGVGYALLTTPVYKIETYLLPPTSQDIEELNIEEMEGSRYDPQTVYELFLENLRSREIRNQFFNADTGSDSMTSRGMGGANQVFVVEKIGDKRSKENRAFSLSLTRSDPERAAQLTNAFAAFAMEQTATDILGALMSMKTSRMDSLKARIAGKRTVALQKRQDEIARLEESLEIARTLRITDDKFSGSAIQPAAIYNIGVSYLRGTKSLEAQIAALKNRKTDDPHIEGLRELQEELDLLASIEIDPGKIRVARIDQPAFVPQSPIKPKKNLIVALSTVGGLFVGIFAVFFVNFVRNAQRKEEDIAA
ncbi:LPS O-antigen chain length determinant protein WzzB, partial [Desulfoplanes sp. PS50]